MLHYNEVLERPWQRLGYDVTFQPCCYIQNFSTHWPIKFPPVTWTDRTWVIMHCQDFLTMDGSVSQELVSIQDHFGDRAGQVSVINWNIGIEKQHPYDLHCTYFPTHSYEFIDRVAAKQDLWQAGLETPRNQIWQCLNGVPRPHRLQVVERLKKLKHGYLSLADDIRLPEFPYTSYRGTENEDNFVRLNYVYGDCDINVVTETIYDYSPGIISEKTLQAFLGLQIPILIGYQGIVEHCRSLGFDMFDDVVDNSYDNLPNDQRLTAALDLNWHLLNNGIDRSNYIDRLRANQQHLLTSWPEQLISNYNQQVNEIHSSRANV